MQWGRCYKTLPLICKINCLQGHTCDCYRSTGYIRSLTVIFLAHVGLTMSTLLVYRQITHTGRCFFFFFFNSSTDQGKANNVHLLSCYGSPCASRLPERCSGGGVEQQEQEGVGRGFGCSSIWIRTVREREEGFLGGASFPPLQSNISGYRNTIPASSSVSFQFISAASKAPCAFTPPKNKKKNSQSLCVSPSLSLSACCCRVFKGWALSLCLFLLRLSLLVTPPCVPTPHLSVSQELRSPAEERGRSAGDPTPAAGGRAGSARGAAAEAPAHKCKERGVEVWGALIASTSTALHITSSPMHQCCAAAAYCPRMMMKRNTHVTLLTSPSKLIEDT